MTENTIQVRVRVSRELLDQIDRQCGLVPRERWMRAVLEAAVGGGGVEATLSEAKGNRVAENAGPVAVLSAATDGVRPVASPLPRRTDIGGRQPVTTMEGGSADSMENDAQKSTRDNDEPTTPRDHGDLLSRQERLNAAKVQRGKPKKGKA